MKSTIIRIDPTTRTTGIQHLPIVSFSYIAGEARIVDGEVPYNLRFSNTKYCEARNLEENTFYLMQWQVVNYPPGLFSSQPTQSIKTEFFELSESPVERAVEIRKLAAVCQGEEEKELAAIEKMKVRLKGGGVNFEEEEEVDFHTATSEHIGGEEESDLPF